MAAIQGNDVALNVIANFDTAEVGIGKLVLISASLSGGDAANYLLDAPNSSRANIIFQPVGYMDAIVSVQRKEGPTSLPEDDEPVVEIDENVLEMPIVGMSPANTQR